MTTADGFAARALKAAEDAGLRIALAVQMAAALLAGAWLAFAYPPAALAMPLGAACAVLAIGAALYATRPSPSMPSPWSCWWCSGRSPTGTRRA